MLYNNTVVVTVRIINPVLVRPWKGLILPFQVLLVPGWHVYDICVLSDQAMMGPYWTTPTPH